MSPRGDGCQWVKAMQPAIIYGLDLSFWQQKEYSYADLELSPVKKVVVFSGKKTENLVQKRTHICMFI